MKRIVYIFIGLLFGYVSTCLAQTNPPSMPLIGILNPMPIEGAMILHNMQNKKTIKVDGITFTSGIFKNNHLIQAFTGEGKVNASVVTTELINHFHSQLIILNGIAGSLDSNLTIGTVVVGNSLYEVEHDWTVSPQDIHNPDDINPITKQLTPDNFDPTGKLIAKVTKLTKESSYPVLLGKIATTDNLPSSLATLQQLQAAHYSAIEMEGAAFMQVCWLFHTPCLVIRGISDLPNLTQQVDQGKQPFSIPKTHIVIAANHAADFTLQLLAALPDSTK